MKELGEFILETARGVLMNKGHHDPLFVIYADGEMFLFDPDFETEKEKQNSVDMVRKLSRAIRAQNVFYVGECFTVLCETMEDARKVNVSESTKAKEALIVKGDDNKGMSCIFIGHIERNENDEIIDLDVSYSQFESVDDINATFNDLIGNSLPKPPISFKNTAKKFLRTRKENDHSHIVKQSNKLH